MDINDEERDIILAALRLWQFTTDVPDDILDIADNNGKHFVMEDSDIDTLCEKLNIDYDDPDPDYDDQGNLKPGVDHV